MDGFHSSVSLGNPRGRNAPEFSQQSSEREREQTSWDVVVAGHSTCITESWD